MSKNTGGPAFPVPHSIDGNWVKEPLEEFRGITMRDYFAAKAMVGICHFWVQTRTKTHINDPDPKIVASMAYEMADAMLAAREAV